MSDLEILESNIFYYKNAIENSKGFIEELNILDNLLQDSSQISKWKEWVSSNSEKIFGVYKDGLFSNSKSITDIDRRCLNISNMIKQIADFCSSDFCEKTGLEKGFLPDPFSIRKYNTDAYMGPHTDSGDDNGSLTPTISMVIYLNDDYEGGEINFINQNINIKPEAGSLIIFPSNEPYVHDPKPVTKGNKYMIPLFWFK
jgi:hypothetical protein